LSSFSLEKGQGFSSGGFSFSFSKTDFSFLFSEKSGNGITNRVFPSSVRRKEIGRENKFSAEIYVCP
jgi:hypothetical protein